LYEYMLVKKKGMVRMLGMLFSSRYSLGGDSPLNRKSFPSNLFEAIRTVETVHIILILKRCMDENNLLTHFIL
jgi:hypothetical protein